MDRACEQRFSTFFGRELAGKMMGRLSGLSRRCSTQ
jgi:hypothetical protein